MNVELPDNRDIPKDVLEQFKENFDLLDADRDGCLRHDEVSILFRAFGQNPTDQELAQMLESEPKLMDYETFISFFQNNYSPPTGEDVLIQAFHVFDIVEEGKITAEKFREVMTTLGDVLPPNEVEEMLKEARAGADGKFDYREFARHLVEGPQGIPKMP
mmetsp:Transcript_4384/g.6709  ORF Transcript_4384/g.6709 Transcript_4384/m.6709 type:complete len:160 (+) Transcript_4384:64-543(+)